MNRTDDFETIFSSALREVANPPLPLAFADRLNAALRRDVADPWQTSIARNTPTPRATMRQASGFSSGVQSRISRPEPWASDLPSSLSRILRKAAAGLRISMHGTRAGSRHSPNSRRTEAPERRRFGPFAWATAVHAAAILCIAFTLATRPRTHASVASLAIPLLEAPARLASPPRAQTAGGGGGQKGPTPVAQGRLPKSADVSLLAPKTAVLQPRLALEPTVTLERNLRMAESTLPNLGLPSSTVIGSDSFGNGSGTGLGSGSGSGIGAGVGGNTGGGALRIGGGVSAPVPLSMPDPEFSEEARKAKLSGNVLVYLWVDTQGRPTHVRVLRGIGMGLDQKAVAAVQQYRFKPALRNGQPVTVEMNVEVNFQIF